jgi:hypothetical protein
MLITLACAHALAANQERASGPEPVISAPIQTELQGLRKSNGRRILPAENAASVAVAANAIAQGQLDTARSQLTWSLTGAIVGAVSVVFTAVAAIAAALAARAAGKALRSDRAWVTAADTHTSTSENTTVDGARYAQALMCYSIWVNTG